MSGTDLQSVALFLDEAPSAERLLRTPLCRKARPGAASGHSHSATRPRRRGSRGPLTISTAAMGMAVFMKTVEEAQGEFSGRHEMAKGEAAQAGPEAVRPRWSFLQLCGPSSS